MNTGTTPLVGATVSLWSTGATAAQVAGSASVTTNASGAFSIHYTCPTSGTLMYVVATGGHVGSGAANANISLTSALGACGGLPTSAGITVNELTTAASAYALSGFASAATAPATVKFQGKSPGLDQAFNTLSNLTNTGTGAFETTAPETNKTFVQQTLDTVANALAACNASTGACTELYTCATPGATYVGTGQACMTTGSPTLATDTLSAALDITQNAGTVSTSGIYDLGTTTKPFSTVLTGSPNDWTLPLVYPFTNYGPLAIDAAGHVWVLTQDPTAPLNTTVVVAELDANFNVLSTGAHYDNGGGMTTFDNTDVTNLAIDSGGNVWVGGGPNSPKIVELNSSGGAVSGSTGYFAGNGPDGTAGVAIDAAGDAWFASGSTNSSVFELGPTGSFSEGNNGITASVCPCSGIVPDPNGNVWIIGGNDNQLAEITGGTQATAVSPPGIGVNATFYSIAADASGNFWMADQHNHGIWEYTPSSTTWSAAPVNYASHSNIAALNNPSHPKGIAIDGAGHIWVANQSTVSSSTPASSLTEFTADGSTNLSPADGFGSGAISGAYSVAIDGSGNVWVADGGTTITQFVGAAAPTKNPIVTAVTTGFTP